MRCIVSRKPKEYLKQSPIGCGAFSVKGILSAYGKDDKQRPFEYLPLGGIPFVLNISHWTNVLSSYGLPAERCSLRGMPDKEKIRIIEDLLRLDTPVMLHIGNGYRGCGTWNALQWWLVDHWITLWGFDDEQKAFYIYDPGVPRHCYDANIPTGNVRRTYAQVLRDIRGGQPWWQRYLYKKISLPKDPLTK